MIGRRSFFSRSIGGEIEYRLLRGAGGGRPPVVYLLHGRGDSSDSWSALTDDLERMPLVAVMPDAPWSSRAGYYVDSEQQAGHQIERALTRDLVAEVDAQLGYTPRRDARIVAGYSMGGFGAVRLALAHPDLFGAAVAVSPAVYVPEPPAGSSARQFGAFGRGAAAYDPARFRELNYVTALATYPADRSLELIVAVGDAEPPHPGADSSMSMAAQATALVESAGRNPGIRTRFRSYPGGHDFGVWAPAILDALRELI